MKTSKRCTMILILATFSLMPLQTIGGTNVDRWTDGPWLLQDMVSWGSGNLVVDFGSNGLWNYDGYWAQLSYWDPVTMVSWGDKNLTVDFGPNGLWNYDGSSWEKIGQGAM